jgi:hypothetical protein
VRHLGTLNVLLASLKPLLAYHEELSSTPLLIQSFIDSTYKKYHYLDAANNEMLLQSI